MLKKLRAVMLLKKKRESEIIFVNDYSLCPYVVFDIVDENQQIAFPDRSLLCWSAYREPTLEIFL